MNSEYVEPVPEGVNTPKFFKIFGSIIFGALLLVMISVIAFNLSFEYHDVEGPSMRPTLNKEEEDLDGVYIFKLAKIKTGDIVVFNSPLSDVLIVKRLVATGGDKIAVVPDGDKYKVMVIKKDETEPTEFDYSFLGGITSEVLYNDFYHKNSNNKSFEMIDGVSYMLIPTHCVFYLGDNLSVQGASEDCADYGPRDKGSIIGKVQIIIKGRKNYLPQILKQLFNAIF